VHVAAEDAESARARLLVLAPAGFEEIERPGTVELAAYTDDLGASAIESAFPGAIATPVEPGWEERWREFHHAVRAGGLWIGPPWDAVPAGETSVVIDPGRAFGTGAHPTTRACLELLARRPPSSLLDAGCGSGVISIAAALLGFDPVIAVDVDPVAVEVAKENAARNRVRIDARRLDAIADPLPSADLVLANIELGIVESLLSRRPAGHAITSGYLAGELPRAPGWTVVESIELEGWAAHVFRVTS
jgi:ribosomal protein L11 methyltransferase